jgi:tRNA(Ile)-lysidine synthase
VDNRTNVRASAAHQVARFATQEKLFRRTKRILAAVSGGPDSVALLLLLLELRGRFGFDVVACHFDHQLRDESAADLARVRELCAFLGVECLSGEGDVRSVARQQRLGIEETARRMRYQFLGFVAGKELADCVATGHTADDQAETVLMRVLRGSGVRGIRGMLPVSPLPESGAQRLIRPLLPLTRAQTRAICDEAGVAVIEDPSNDDPAYLRNRLRHEVLPVLRFVNPSLNDALVGLAASAREVFANVDQHAMSVQPTERGPIGAMFPLAALRELENEALTMVVEREAAFYSLEPEPNRTRLSNLRRVLTAGTGSVAFGGGCVVEASSGRVRVGPPLEPVEPFPQQLLNVPGVTLAGPWRVTVTTDAVPLQGAVTLSVPSTGLQGALRVRPLQPGDRIRLGRRDRRVSDVLADRRVPIWERANLVAIADSQRVIALVGAFGAISDPAGADPLHVSIAQRG